MALESSTGLRIFRIVLDLDETLIHCRQQISDEEAKLDKFKLGDGSIILIRPYFYDFLGFIADRFDEIYIYTAATDVYAREVTNVIFRGVPLTQIWTRGDCSCTETSVHKTLRNKVSKYGAHVDNVHTVIIDDRGEVSADNMYAYGQNHIVIPRFEGSTEDTCLQDVMRMLTDWKKTKL